MNKQLLILTLASGALFTACAAPELERLDDEPASTEHLTLPQSRRTHPAIDGCQRFLVALREGHYETAFRHLSSDTRKAMTLKAQAVGWQGDDVLRQGKIPISQDVKLAAPFDPVAIFALPSIQTLQLLATPSSGSSTVEQRIRIKSVDGKARDVTMRFEGLAWRIHNPDLTSTQN
jgi:hypothetical protein